MLVRGDLLAKGMSQYLMDEIEETPNITVLLNTQVVEAQGEQSGSRHPGPRRHGQTGDRRRPAPCSSLSGPRPHTDWLDGVVQRDEHGFILAGPDVMPGRQASARAGPLDRDPFLLETSVPGVFAAGDVLHRIGQARRLRGSATAPSPSSSSISIWQGETQLETVTLQHSDTGQQEKVAARALFIFIGAAPRTDWLDGVVQRDDTASSWPGRT